MRHEMVFGGINGAVRLTALVSVFGLAACDGVTMPTFSSPAPTRTVQTISPPSPDSRGVITYATYQV
ncbi:MAG TPA: hypothetical protein VLA51_00360, partial [Paracoccaceae bacterium]|nr:hypothetical protein [Paracoccaceae bacterium]